MKYYAYGSLERLRGEEENLEGLIGTDTVVYKYILRAMKNMQDYDLHETKVRLVSGFHHILIYDKKLSDKDLKKYKLTYIGVITYITEDQEDGTPLIILTVNTELKAETIDLELTTVECETILRFFDYVEKYGASYEMEKYYMMNYRSLKKICWKMEDVLNEVAE